MRDFSTAAADTLELVFQQLFPFIRRALDVAVIVAAMAAREFSSVPAKSVTAARPAGGVKIIRSAAMKRDIATMADRAMREFGNTLDRWIMRAR